MKKLLPIVVIMILVFSAAACRITPSLTLSEQQKTLTPGLSTPNVPNIVPTLLAKPGVKTGGSAAQLDATLVTLYQQVNPGVVSIVVETGQGISQGSGFVYDYDGHIITNYHVVEGNVNLEVDFVNGLKVRGKVIATDLDSDLAVIEVDVPADQLSPLPMGDSDSIQVGQIVVAIGNPFSLSSTMTMGIVSAKGRILDSMRQTAEGSSFTAADIIQTDAAINPGNSGGPLLNLDGEVVGINRAIRTSGTTTEGEPVNSGIGFAISINIVKRVVPYLIRDGQYDYPYLGISALSGSLTLSNQQYLNLSQATGAYVIEVVNGGPAERAGLRGGSSASSATSLPVGGDLIIAVDGRPVIEYGDLINYVMINKSPGDEILLTILRGTDRKEVTLKLGKRP